MNLAYLRQQTAPEHEAVEAMLPLGSESLSRGQYIDVLQRFYLAVAAWDRWAAAHAPEHLLPMVRQRQRAGLLERDLRFFGAEPAELSIVRDFERAMGRAETEAAFLGRMYVVEGSTLGGQHIARMVEPRLGLNPGEGDAYFRGYGERTGSMWREFQAVLGAVPDADMEEVVRGARTMFACFAQALGDPVPQTTL